MKLFQKPIFFARMILLIRGYTFGSIELCSDLQKIDAIL